MNTSPQASVVPLSIELPPAEQLKLEKAAELKKMTVQEFLIHLVQVSTHLESSELHVS